jgi:hypothetical protein
MFWLFKFICCTDAIFFTIYFFTKYFLSVGPDRTALLPQGGAGVCRHRCPHMRRRRRGSRRRSRRCREDRPSRTRVWRRDERRSIATSSSRGASPGGKPVTPSPLPPPRASARPPPPHGNRPAHPPWRRWVRVRSKRRLPTTLLTQTWRPWCPPPLSKIMSKKHDEDMGYIGKKNISVQLWLVRVDLTQRMIKKHVYSLRKHTFCQRTDQLRVEQVVIK